MSLRKFDIFPKLDTEYRVGTTIGGILSLFSIAATIFLSWVEISAYRHPPIRQSLFIESIRPTELDGTTISARSQPRLDIAVNITFPHAPCYLLHFDALDPVTQLPLPLDEVTSSFTRLSRAGASLGPRPPDFLDSDIQADCGSCYLGESGCCHSCQDVFAAYRDRGFRPPPLREVAQCRSVVDRLSAFAGEGCRVAAQFRAVRVGGEFHVAPGVSWFSEGWHVHDVTTFGMVFEDINLTHRIERLTFVPDSAIMPLDGTESVHAQRSSWRAVYTADILGSNFSVSRFSMDVRPPLGPGIFFKYDVSPIGALPYVDREPLLHLVGRLLTVIGGVLGLFRLIDAVSYSSRKRAGKKAVLDPPTGEVK